MKKKLLILLFLLLIPLTSCKEKEPEKEQITKLSFKSAASYDYLTTLDNKKVQINGYMATSSPVDGSFIFLMNLPYQSCPFCVPNTTQLSNTMEVYPKKNEKFTYVDAAIKVIGTLKVAVDQNNPYTDQYGYEFVFKIIDAEYKILKDEELSGNVALFQKLANANVVNDLYAMYDYLNFVCTWPEYFVNSYTDSSGNIVPGYYLYASDAIHFIETDGAQYNYGFKTGYFDNLIAKFNNISTTGFEDIINNINKAHTLADYAYNELKSGNYTYEYKYVEKFGTNDYIYTMNDTTLKAQFNNIYYEFSDWLGSFEM